MAVSRIFWDTNIVLDLLAERHPYYEPAAKLATLADQGRVILVCSALTFATAHYLLSKFGNAVRAKESLRKFKVICEVCPIDEAIVEKGLNADFTDFEDSLQYYSAIKANCGVIITRNAPDFKLADIPVMNAQEYLSSIKP
ncbi:type II toxin-antitoxin system VapC family toxin [Parapedobacter sp. 2B3]|uniref:type II toxin-antitoxin system VapC family toxin n=1 Tax=Parapedobacter sp. 2B3 TaxID=3342381 RepID=UPI0035B604D7